MKRMLRNAAIIIAINVLILIVFFIIGEIYARHVYNYPGAAGIMMAHPVFHHLPPPYHEGRMFSKDDFDVPFKLNNRGMRGSSDYIYEKGRDSFRIAVLGDSFTFGIGVESSQTASADLERLLNASGRNRYEVMNFGVSSYSPLLEYIYLTQEVVRYKPDLVLLMLDASDVQDDYLYESHIVRDAGGNIVGCNPLMRSGRPDTWQWCLRHSRLLYIIDLRFFESLRKIKAIGPTTYMKNKFSKKRNKKEIVLNKDIDNIRFDRFLLYREGKNRAVIMRHWMRTAKFIKMIKDYLDNRGIKFALVIYPYGHQISADQWGQGREYWAFERNRVYDPAQGISIITDFAKQNGIDLINLYDAFLRDKDEKLFFDIDGHWTPRGHEIAAGAIYNAEVFQKDLR